MAVPSACLDDNDAAEFASGALSGAAATRVETHLASCRDCRALVAALAPSGGDADSDIATVPIPAKLPRGKHRKNLALDPTLPRSPHEPTISVGDTIGRYVVLARLGAGGMGVVWSAYDPQLDRKVALKLLRAGSGVESSEGRARLVREAQAIAQLSHPNVVAVYDVGTADSGEVYIAMEFVEGETLTAWLSRWERPWRELLDVFLQAGRGLAAAHAVGLLHRDFKPDNVLVGTDGRVRVTDFGLARSLITAAAEDEKGRPAPSLASLRVTLTATGTILGTPRYMAPEQVRGKDTDARSDQFSYCVALFESLYGRHPLPGDTAVEMVEKGTRAQAAPDGVVPASIAKALGRGLEMEPSRRFPSMQTLLHELTPPPARTRERWLVMGLGGVLAAAAAAAAVMATGSSAAPALEPDERHALLDRIKKLEAERGQLIRDIETFRNNAQKLGEVQTMLAARDQEIQALVQQIQVMTPDAGAPATMPMPPMTFTAPTPAMAPGGLSVSQARGVLDKLEFSFCLGEWRARAGDDQNLTVAATMLVTPDGVPHNVTIQSDDPPLVICLQGRLSHAHFPTFRNQTGLAMSLRLSGDRIVVQPRIDSVRNADGLLDAVDMQRP